MKRLKALRFFIPDKTVPFWKKLIIFGGIAYLLSPVDLIPMPVLLFSWVDDLALWVFILYFFADELDKYWIGEERVTNPKAFRGKHIIRDAKYEVREEDGKEQEEKG